MSAPRISGSGEGFRFAQNPSLQVSWYVDALYFLEPFDLRRWKGWSYSLEGRLAKAPNYEELPSFDKSTNGLFPIHVHVDRLGFIWINLHSGPKPAEAWEDDFASVDEQERLQQFNMSEYHFDHQWSMIGEYNWKTLADNYNEVRNDTPLMSISAT